jgi:integrase
MKYFVFIIGSSIIALVSCIESNFPSYKFPFDESKITSGYVMLEEHRVELRTREIHSFITKTKNAKCRGLIKGIVFKRIELINSSNDTLQFRFLKNGFKDNFNGDKAYEISDTNFLNELINRAEIRGLFNHHQAIINLTNIFEDYKNNEEAIESDDNKNLVTNSLRKINPKILTEKDLILLIDYWIYYDPTDFCVKDKIKPKLLDIAIDLKSACLTRKLNRYKWEYNNKYFDKTIGELETLK